MKIGTFRRQVVKTFAAKETKTALKTTAKNTGRTLVAQHGVALKLHSGRLLQVMQQYLLGVQQTQEMKDHAFVVMGDIGYDLTALGRLLKVKVPPSTKKAKLTGTRSAALLMFDGLTTHLLQEIYRGLLTAPAMTTMKKLVTIPATGAKEEREVLVVDTEANDLVEAERQNEMRSYLSGAIDVYWRLSFDVFGYAPAALLAAKFKRMQAEFPGTVWAEDQPKAQVQPVVKAPLKAVKTAKTKKSA